MHADIWYGRIAELLKPNKRPAGIQDVRRADVFRQTVFRFTLRLRRSVAAEPSKRITKPVPPDRSRGECRERKCIRYCTARISSDKRHVLIKPTNDDSSSGHDRRTHEADRVRKVQITPTPKDCQCTLSIQFETLLGDPTSTTSKIHPTMTNFHELRKSAGTNAPPACPRILHSGALRLNLQV